MTQSELLSYMRQIEAEMAADYQRIVSRAIEDPGTAGDRAEESWAEFLRGWLPGNVHVVTKGRILCPNGYASPQMDIVVLSDSYPKRLLSGKMHLSSQVIAAFECKLTLRGRHMAKIFTTVASLKREVYIAHGRDIIFGVLAHSHEWVSAEKAAEAITRRLTRLNMDMNHPLDMIDLLCLSNVGTWRANRSALGIGGEEGDIPPATTWFHSPAAPDERGRDGDHVPVGQFLSQMYMMLAAGLSNQPSVSDLLNFFTNGGLSIHGRFSSEQVRRWWDVPPVTRFEQ